jgi:hypothetical protein
MISLTSHEVRLSRRMVAIIDEFLLGELRFSAVVGELEGALDAAELKDEFAKRWYDVWQALETRRAIRADDVSPEEVREDLSVLRRLVTAYLDEAASTNG